MEYRYAQENGREERRAEDQVKEITYEGLEDTRKGVRGER